MRIGTNDYKTKKECSPCTLDYNSILRGDNIIIYTKKDLYDICTSCNSKEECLKLMNEAKQTFLKTNQENYG